jgi:hypothetical protein
VRWWKALDGAVGAALTLTRGESAVTDRSQQFRVLFDHVELVLEVVDQPIPMLEIFSKDTPTAMSK